MHRPTQLYTVIVFPRVQAVLYNGQAAIPEILSREYGIGTERSS